MGAVHFWICSLLIALCGDFLACCGVLLGASFVNLFFL